MTHFSPTKNRRDTDSETAGASARYQYGETAIPIDTARYFYHNFANHRQKATASQHRQYQTPSISGAPHFAVRGKQHPPDSVALSMNQEDDRERPTMKKQAQEIPAKLMTRRSRSRRCERFFVEASLFIVSLVSVATVALCLAFAFCRGVVDASPDLATTSSSSLADAAVPPEFPETVSPDAWFFRYIPEADAALVRAMKPVCVAHVAGIPFAIASFVGFGIAYLIAGGCRGTPCARLEGYCVRASRTLIGVMLGGLTLMIGEMLAMSDVCILLRRTCSHDLDDGGDSASWWKLPSSKSIALVITMSILILVYSAFYLNFALSGSREDAKRARDRRKE